MDNCQLEQRVCKEYGGKCLHRPEGKRGESSETRSGVLVHIQCFIRYYYLSGD